MTTIVGVNNNKIRSLFLSEEICFASALFFGDWPNISLAVIESLEAITFVQSISRPWFTGRSAETICVIA